MDELEKRVRETVGKLLTDQELTGFSLTDVPPDGWPSANLWLTLHAGKEQFVLALVPKAGPGYVYETLDELNERIYSALQDWIAESTHKLRSPS